MNGLSFAAPLYLWALAALPLLWWLLRLTPPAPARAVFPPLRLMAKLQPQAAAAAKSPWWLTLLRLLLAAALILAFAQPVYKSAAPPIGGDNGPLFLLLDNDWAGAALRQSQLAQARNILAAAAKQSRPIFLIAAAAAPNAEIGPMSANQAGRRLSRPDYYALPADRSAAFARLAKAAAAYKGQSLTIAYLTNGLAGADDPAAFKQLGSGLAEFPHSRILVYQPPQLPAFAALKAGQNAAQGLQFTLMRLAGAAAPAAVMLQAYDARGQMLAEQQAAFPAGAAEMQAMLKLPPELANAVSYARLAPAGAASGQSKAALPASAAGLWLMSDAQKQKTVAMLAPEMSRLAQPLLSPFYYIDAALANAPGVAGGRPVSADGGTIEQNIDRLLAARPALIILGDTAHIPPAAAAKLRQWVAQGGTLFRFAGDSIAEANAAGAGPTEADTIFGSADDDSDDFAAAPPPQPAAPPAPLSGAELAKQTLLPVKLRPEARSFGGTLSWEKPQKIAPFPPASPFYGLAAPQDITVSRQILAEPSADLAAKSWISLTDGTPLMTAAPLGKGRLIFLHTAPGNGWSNLALSGFFVEMMRRLVAISGNGGGDKGQLSPAQRQSLPPYRIITAAGELESAPDNIRPLSLGGIGADGRPAAPPEPGFYNPPGFYGSRGALYPLNLLNSSSRLAPLALPPLPAAQNLAYSNADSAALQKALLMLAAWLFIADIALSLLLKGRIGGGLSGGFGAAWQKAERKAALPAILLLAAAFAAPGLAPRPALAANADSGAEQSAGGLDAAALAGQTHLAYVITGNAETDAISQSGLENLSNFIAQRTTIEPGIAVGVRPGRDELAFYPLLYWPVEAAAAMPDQKAIDAIDAYMRQGGTVLFDTKDALESSLALSGAAANTARLRQILKGLNVPPLAPAPKEQVIARSFYIMPDFPGRYRSSPLWIAAEADSGDKGSIRGGDGVSPLIITANDFAGAWAGDGAGGYRFPLVPGGNGQRLWAFRGGLNILMYVLTGNYKVDQARAPELLRRFGQ